MTKYHNKKIQTEYGVFDSKREYKRFLELKAMQESGEIVDLQRQIKYELIPSQRVNGKVAERAMTYTADFVYTQNGQTVVEDCKGFRTEVYKVKKKLMLYRYNIQIKES